MSFIILTDTVHLLHVRQYLIHLETRDGVLHVFVYPALYLCGSTPCGWVGSGRVEWDAATFSWISKARMVGWGIPLILAHHDLEENSWRRDKAGDNRGQSHLFLSCNMFLGEIKQMRYFLLTRITRWNFSSPSEQVLFWLSRLIKADPEEAEPRTASGNQSGVFYLYHSKQQHSHCQPGYWSPLWVFNPHN